MTEISDYFSFVRIWIDFSVARNVVLEEVAQNLDMELKKLIRKW